MSISARLTRLPRAYDPDRGADALSAVPHAPGPVLELLKGTAGSSPYLADLMRQESAWLEAALAGTPESARDGVIADLMAAPMTDIDAGLRRAKRRMALWIALMDLGGIWTLEDLANYRVIEREPIVTQFGDMKLVTAPHFAVHTTKRHYKAY